MSKISTVGQAHEALCNGEFFQVGGKIINPEDIVRFEYGEEPIFHLEDGSTVQHNRFKEGSVGDLLAEAMTVATRGNSQAEMIKPEWNRFLLGGLSQSEGQLYDSDAVVLVNYNIFHSALDTNAGYVFQQFDGSLTLAREDQQGGNDISTTITNGTDNQFGLALNRGAQEIFISRLDNNADVIISRYDYDLNKIGDLYGPISAASGNDPHDITIDEDTGKFFANVGTNNFILKGDLDGSGAAQKLSLNNFGSGNSQAIVADTENKRLWMTERQNQNVWHLDYNGSKLNQYSAPDYPNDLSFAEAADTLFFCAGNNQIRKFDRSFTQTGKISLTTGAYRIDFRLDLSVI